MTREQAFKELKKINNENTVVLLFSDVENLVSNIFDDFENRVCNNCEYFVKQGENYGKCRKHFGNVNTRKVFTNDGCNSFKKKTN